MIDKLTDINIAIINMIADTVRRLSIATQTEVFVRQVMKINDFIGLVQTCQYTVLGLN